MKTRRIAMVLLGLALCMMWLPFAGAAEAHGEAETEGKESAAKIPDTVGGIWHEVKEHEAELAKIIADKKLDHVHDIAYEIRDFINALPDKSGDLPAEKLARVKANAKYVAILAKRLDESGDAGDQAATEANFKKFQGFLKAIGAQYPPAALKYVEKEKDERK